jgi:hypothetical protein
MKNLIILLLVIGAVVNALDLTTVTGERSIDDPLWTITYGSRTASNYYNFVVTYSAGTTASTEAVATGNVGINNMGVACYFTDSTFALTSGTATYRGFSLSVGNAASSSAVTSAASGWTTLALVSHTLLTYTVAGTTTTYTTPTLPSTIIPCPLVFTPVAVTPVLSADFTATWTFAVANTCGQLPAIETAWHAVCFHSKTGTNLFTAAAAAVVVQTDTLKNVTYTAPTTTCSTTTGASTFATGATILAGIAYLQF